MKTTYQYTAFLLFPLLLLLVLATGPSLSAQTETYYVDAAKANNDGDGMSWATAKKDLQVALDLATVGDEIRVASGTYLPTETPNNSADNRDKAFHFNKNVVLKGSYDPDTDTQDYNNPSILSGDLGTLGNTSDNAYHVLITASLTAATTIDGFTFSGGNADGTDNLTYSTKTFDRNSGGGMYNNISSPTITNSSFSGNTASDSGGGLHNVSSSPTITNSTFSGNFAGGSGGGMYNFESSSPTITNSLFSENTATRGGGMYNFESSSPRITNSTFSRNSATKNGGGMRNFFASPTLYNTVFYENTAAIGSDIDGDAINGSSSHNASDGTGGNINAGAGFVALTSEEDPFTDSTDPDGADDMFGTADDGLIPHATSPLIDAGVNGKNTEMTDVIGRTRILGTAIDIGAYEFQPSLSSDGLGVETTAFYPNPTSSAVNLSYATATNTNYSLYDISGKRLATYTQSGTAHQLDVSTVSKGTYILKAISGLQVNYYRIVKE